MSSDEEDTNGGENSGSYQSLKKRRIQRACDTCRRKKRDGVQTPGNRCSNCLAYSFDCTYVEAAPKKRGPSKGCVFPNPDYVESLENRVKKLENLVRRLCPDDALYDELIRSLDDNLMVEQLPVDPSSLVTDSSCHSNKRSTTDVDSVTSAICGVANGATPPTGLDDDNDNDDDTSVMLADNLKRMALEPHEYRFFGKSSAAILFRTAVELRNEYMGSQFTLEDVSTPRQPSHANPRTEFWTVPPWERKFNSSENIHYIFPEPDLAVHFMDLYFTHVNIYLPLLHRPTFEKYVQEGLHLANANFAPVYLLVCAVGAQYSDDPKARLEGVDSYHSCGWKWFDQVQMKKQPMLAPPTLFDLQLYCLSVQFLQGSSSPSSSWTLVGIGIRLAQDVGVHRRALHAHALTADAELWKRAFWVLVCLDRAISSTLGRPCAIQDDDFDLDLPVDCDDEYWENPDPEKCFKQPSNKPSSISYFILYIKLHQILAFSLRTIYSLKKSKTLLGFVGQRREQHLVEELDSMLNKWVDSVPDHLQWDPNHEDVMFFNQSVSLYSAYYHIQILIHRPFIPSPSNPSPLSFPSLTICTNAARSCSRVVDIQRQRNMALKPQILSAVFTSGMVLLLRIWGGKRSGLSTDPNREMADVHKCMDVLRTSEVRWYGAGKVWHVVFFILDLLNKLAFAGELPLPQHSSPSTNKRERDSETPKSPSQQPPAPPIHLRYSELANGYPPISEMSSMTHGYGMDATAMDAGMVLDTIAGTLAYSPQNTYGVPPIDGTSSMVAMQGLYRGMSRDTSTMGDINVEQSQQHGQQIQPEQLQLREMGYPLVDDNTMAMWSSAPTGFG
ncbi:fungal-specific transcription factor domain-containing protein [Flammula alnicola]|nr:fungal-specific transcription factor domain-containing protein [Flammula alnicola]